VHVQDALGAVIRTRRQDLGLTQVNLGEKAGYAKGPGAAVSINRIENGRTMPGAEKLAAIGLALGTDADGLLSQATADDIAVDDLFTRRASGPAGRGAGRKKRDLTPKERLRHAEEALNERIERVQTLADGFYSSHEGARGQVRPDPKGFLLPFGAEAATISDAAFLPGTDDAPERSNDPDRRIRLTRSRISAMLSHSAGGAVAGAGVGGAAAFGAFAAAATWGTASTGTLISTLSGVAATNATLAALGGGALAAGGAGIFGGTMVLAGIVAAPALILGGAGLAVAYRKHQTQMAETAEKLEQALNGQAAGYTALIEYLNRGTGILDYVRVHATHALERWRTGLPPVDGDGVRAWANLTPQQQDRYHDFITIAACYLSVVVEINPQAFMAAPTDAGTNTDTEHDDDVDFADPVVTVDDLRRHSNETLTYARDTITALV